ncbi:MAG TPA: hypothetical protein VMG31_12640 [Verrucomicrobiae bacterium]|nr:hypothetical protein [Verrucomicrobiae bacterium]
MSSKPVVENYFTYFTEIEEHFLRRRCGGLLLSTLDWALIETWKDAGIPLEAVLRGIDAAFDKYDQRPSKTQKVNSLAYCSQAVLTAAEDMKEAVVGANATDAASPKSRAGEGFEPAAIATFLRRNADALDNAKLPARGAISAQAVAAEVASSLRQCAEDLAKRTPARLEDLERRLTVLEEKLFAALLASTPDEEIVAVRSDADRDLAPYRRRMSSAQIEQLHKQYVQKRLLEKSSLPRLSLFYMT